MATDLCEDKEEVGNIGSEHDIVSSLYETRWEAEAGNNNDKQRLVKKN
jgi:hypothetical protein